MKQTLGINDIAQELRDDFSHGAAYALAEYLEDLDPDAELDVVAVRCDFSEYASLQEWAEDYFGTSDWKKELGVPDSEEEHDDGQAEILRYINDHGTLIEFDGGVVVSNF